VNVPGLVLMVAGWFVGTAGVLAQVASGGGGSDPLAQLTGYGALGLVVLGAVIGQIRFKPEVSALREDMQAQAKTHATERERMQNQIDALLDVNRTQVLPTLLTAAEALRTSAEQAQRMATQISLLTDTLRDRR
jgi:hypothetical protein